MRTTFLALMILLPLVAAPAHATSSAHERNVAFFWSLVGEIDPSTDATMPDGRVIPLAQAIDEAAARAGTADLASLASGAGDGSETYIAVGDVWVIDVGIGECVANVIAATPVPNTAFHGQLWTYAGGLGQMSGYGSVSLSAISWTGKTSYSGTGHWEATGQMDFYCVSFGGFHLAFPFINGIVEVTPDNGGTDAPPVQERNAAFLWSLIGEVDPLTDATMPDGRVIPLADAIDDAAARAGSVDLAAMVHGAAPGPDTYVGDIWLIEVGPGGCVANVIAATPVPYTAFHPQLSTYAGGIGTLSSQGGMLTVIAHTTKQTASYADAVWTATGQQDFYCIDLGGIHLAFPFLDGIVEVTPNGSDATPMGERNAAFLWSLVGDVDPLTDATMPDGRVIPLADAIWDAAARAGSVDLAAMVSGADDGDQHLYVGSMWVIEIGEGDCTANVIAATPVPSTAIHPQLYTYGGSLGTLSTTHGYTTSVIGWATKETGTFNDTEAFTAFGTNDFYCFSFSGLHLAFPFVNGSVMVRE